MIGIRSWVVAAAVSASVAAPAMAQRRIFMTEGQPIGLLSETAVQRALKLDEGQMKAAAEATDRASKRALRAAVKVNGMPKEQRAEALRAEQSAAAEDYRKDLASFLKPEQARWLRTMTIRRFQSEVFRDPAILDDLELTEAQRARVDEILRGSIKEKLAISAMMRDRQKRKEASDQAMALHKKVLGDIVGLLNDAQKARWDAMQAEQPAE